MLAPLLFAVSTVFAAPQVSQGQNLAQTGKTLPPPPVFQQNPKDASVALDDVADANKTLRLASKALNQLQTVEANFIQTGPDGTVVEGRVFLRRPGKARFDYTPPYPFLIVSDGVTIAKIDRDLETSDRVPLSTTPLGIFLRDHVDLSRDGEIISVKKAGARIFVSLQDPKGEVEGQLTLVFEEKGDGLGFTGWAVTDGLGYMTIINLKNMKKVDRLNPRLFLVDEAENSVLKKSRKTRR